MIPVVVMHDDDRRSPPLLYCRDSHHDPEQILKPGLPGSSWATTELAQWKSKRQPSAYFVDRMAVSESMTQTNVEAEVITHAPNEPDQTGYGLGLTKFLFIEKLRDGPDRPF